MSWQNGEPEPAPNVYLPHGDGESTPVYEAYEDPAQAHGWQDAYVVDGVPGAHGVEETVELSEVPGAPEVPGLPAVYEGEGPVGPDRHARLMQRRRARLVRRVVVTAGAVCVVGLVLALTGAFGSGSSEGSKPGGRSENGGDRKASAPAESGSGSSTDERGSTAPSSTTSGASTGPDDDSPSASATTSAGASKSPSDDSTPSTPTSTGSDGQGPGNSGDKSGRGKGSTKAPG